MMSGLTTNSKLPRGNPTKQRVLELLAEFFCLRTNDAAELLRNRTITESDARYVRRTLSILHRDGFLYRTPHLDFGHERRGIAYVYGLSAKGVSHALRNGYSTLATKTLDEHSLRTLDHELELTSFHTRSTDSVQQRASAMRGSRRISSTRSIRTRPSTSRTRRTPARRSAISWRSNARSWATTGTASRRSSASSGHSTATSIPPVAKRNGGSASTAWSWSSGRTPGARGSSRHCGRNAATGCSGSRPKLRTARTSAARSSRRRKMTLPCRSPSLRADRPCSTIHPIARKGGITSPVSRRLWG